MIYEVAVKNSGGDTQLNTAINRGDVTKRGGMFFFRRATVGQRSTWGSQEQMSRVQDRTALDFAEYAASIDSIVDNNSTGGDAHRGELLALMNLSSASSRGSADPVFVEQSIEALTKKKARLAGAVKLAENLIEKLDKYNGTTPVPPRASQSVGEMLQLFEDAENKVAAVTFMLKFKKDNKGQPLTSMMAKGVNDTLDVLSDKIIEEIKIVRAVAAFALK